MFGISVCVCVCVIEWNMELRKSRGLLKYYSMCLRWKDGKKGHDDSDDEDEDDDVATDGELQLLAKSRSMGCPLRVTSSTNLYKVRAIEIDHYKDQCLFARTTDQLTLRSAINHEKLKRF